MIRVVVVGVEGDERSMETFGAFER